MAKFKSYSTEQGELLPTYLAELGYVTLGHVSVDGSKIKAHASKHKAMSRKRMKQEIARLEQEMKEALAVAEDEKPEEPLELFPPSADERMSDRATRLEKIRQALHDLEERKPEAQSQTPGKNQINFTDSESRIMDTRTQGVIQGYNPQICRGRRTWDHRGIAYE